MNLREFSELLGLSPTTVSRALGGYPEVREETRKRVREAAALHGYRPNRRAAALATGRAMAIGHVIPSSLNHEMVNPVFADFIAGAGEIYARAGYDMLISVVSDGDEEGAYRKMAEAGSVDGTIVHGPRQEDKRIELLRETGIPFVVHGRTGEGDAEYSFVDVDNRRAFKKLTDHLLDLGHRRIALANGLLHLDFARRRQEGWAEALRKRGIDPDPALASSDEMTEQAGYLAMRNALALPNPPTAMIACSYIMGLGVQRALHEAGLTPGKEVSVALHDDMLSYLSNGATTPTFTASRSSVRAAGIRCAEILLQSIANPNGPIVQEVWQSELVLSTTTGPVVERP
ncbi:MAG: substrate-binding domain-containing protein [Pseudomonadota bacterium]